ncbi:hypothetical protein HYH03_010843 [Edaphochlamys debaryana]|uniref:Uncharacterized protein n=1 Tax=Edaphochlamys debaryana TaxID=47281 RepID=A0A836BX07_9CHLO|nr:hypothetical protein HYH03_010843 [Edaphochlamys debaryana]|eukprot:KAG2490674.1 hypothetical protein HYH03_010843 [Edaphochlamys debaryana]
MAWETPLGGLGPSANSYMTAADSRPPTRGGSRRGGSTSSVGQQVPNLAAFTSDLGSSPASDPARGRSHTLPPAAARSSHRSFTEGCHLPAMGLPGESPDALFESLTETQPELTTMDIAVMPRPPAAAAPERRAPSRKSLLVHCLPLHGAVPAAASGDGETSPGPGGPSGSGSDAASPTCPDGLWRRPSGSLLPGLTEEDGGSGDAGSGPVYGSAGPAYLDPSKPSLRRLLPPLWRASIGSMDDVACGAAGASPPSAHVETSPNGAAGGGGGVASRDGSSHGGMPSGGGSGSPWARSGTAATVAVYDSGPSAPDSGAGLPPSLAGRRSLPPMGASPAGPSGSLGTAAASLHGSAGRAHPNDPAGILLAARFSTSTLPDPTELYQEPGGGGSGGGVGGLASGDEASPVAAQAPTPPRGPARAPLSPGALERRQRAVSCFMPPLSRSPGPGGPLLPGAPRSSGPGASSGGGYHRASGDGDAHQPGPSGSGASGSGAAAGAPLGDLHRHLRASASFSERQRQQVQGYTDRPSSRRSVTLVGALVGASSSSGGGAAPSPQRAPLRAVSSTLPVRNLG